MKRIWFVPVVVVLVAGGGRVASAQQPTTPDTTVTPPVSAPPVTPPPVTPPPATPPPVTQAPPPPAPAAAAPARPMAMRYGGLAGLYTMPTGDFEQTAADGWGIMIMGEQYVTPTRAASVTSEVGYLDFGTKEGTNTDFSMFPVQVGLRFYPTAKKKPDSKSLVFGQGGLGFFTTRSEFLGASNYDYFFGLNAGAGIKLQPNPIAAVVFDATWNWVFGDNVDPNYLAFRGSIMVGR